MTRGQFNGAWALLQGAGLPTRSAPNPDVFFAALQDVDAVMWGAVVQRAIKECAFFPTPFSLREFASGLLSEQIRAKQVHPQDQQRALASGREAVEFRGGHPDLPRQEDEGFCEYLERLAIFLGFKTGANTSDPRADHDLAARMRADAARAAASWTDR